jgi:DNA-binding NtrC family response regulator
MRALFARLERAAAASATVLLEGETGTGKSAAARSLHAEGPRSGGPFVMIDCGAIPANLLESELFGHEKGAFTGAAAARVGAFEEADGGTLFLDEIGELPIELQPKLLSALEDRAVRRVGSNSRREVDVRLIAATNRDLRAEVNATRFREDLYFRIAVLRITLPPLRLRPKDLPELAANLLDRLGALPGQRDALLTPELIERLQASAWPGNVRELRNYLEQCLVFDGAVPLETPALPADNAIRVDTSLPFADAKRRAQAEIERAYLVELLAISGGKVARAAAAAGIDRTYFYKLLRRHGIQPAKS